MARALSEPVTFVVKGSSFRVDSDHRFLEIALGSLRELHSQLGLLKRLGYSDELGISTCESKMVAAGQVLGALLRSVRG